MQIAEHERQFRELLELCPAALDIVDDDGRLLLHNARLRELLGYEREELDRIDTRTFWQDLEQRSRIIAALRDQGGQLLNEEVVWRTKKGQLVHLLISYVQVAYRGGHVSFVGGKRLCWVYDVTALTQREAQVAEQERQLREILEYCPAGLIVADDEGRLLFHNARLRERRKQLPIEQKESIKWLRSYRKVAAIQKLCPDTTLISMGDRESDIYELFAEAIKTPDAPRLLIRADKARQRKSDQQYLWDLMAQQPVAGSLKIHIPHTGNQKAREAG